MEKSKLQLDIENLINRRNSLIDNSNDEKFDLLSGKIFDLLKDNCDKLPVDFILDSLTHLGQAPSLLYDDEGHWAVSSDGYQQVSITGEPMDMTMSVFIEKKMWKNSIREALQYYMEND